MEWRYLFSLPNCWCRYQMATPSIETDLAAAFCPAAVSKQKLSCGRQLCWWVYDVTSLASLSVIIYVTVSVKFQNLTKLLLISYRNKGILRAQRFAQIPKRPSSQTGYDWWARNVLKLLNRMLTRKHVSLRLFSGTQWRPILHWYDTDGWLGVWNIQD